MFSIKRSMFSRTMAGLVATLFLANSVMPSPVYAQAFDLPAPGLGAASAYAPVSLRAINIRENQPLVFDFVVDSGSSGLQGDGLKKETEKLAKYFLAAVTVPEKDLWVNLSPYENDRIIPAELGTTEMGREMLAQDAVLKQISAAATNPDSTLGKLFWGRVYAKAQETLGTTNIPLDTFNKIWIVPGKAKVYEKGNTALLGEATLKVMLDADYLALGVNETVVTHENGDAAPSPEARAISMQMMREVLVPEIEKMVNTAPEFATLRQFYGAMVLATWYKQALKESLIGQVYADQNKTAGVTTSDPAAKDRIYQEYLKQFKQGAYNFIKEEQDPVTGTVQPRQFFSGGENFAQLSTITEHVPVSNVLPAVQTVGTAAQVTIALTKPEAVSQATVNAAMGAAVSGKALLEEHKQKIAQRTGVAGLGSLGSDFEMTADEKGLFLASIKAVMKEKNAAIVIEKDKIRVVTADILREAASRALPQVRSTVAGKVGLLPGTLNPVSYANLTLATAGIIDGDLNGVIVANGGLVPEKPYVPGAEIRNGMLKAAIKGEGLEEQVASTNIRQQMVDMLSAPFSGDDIGVKDDKNKGFIVTGKDADGQRRKMDIAAFIWLFTAYPNVKWTYMVDSDKIRQYGPKDEKELLQLLADRGVTILYTAPEKQEIVPDKDFRAYDWLKNLSGMFKQVTTKTAVDIQLQAVRKAVMENDEVAGDALIPASVYAYISQEASLKMLYAWEYAEVEADKKVTKGEITQAVADYFQIIVAIDKAAPAGAMPDGLKKKLKTIFQNKIALLTEVYSAMTKDYKKAGVSKEEAVRSCLTQLRNLDAQKDSLGRIISESMADALESFVLGKLMSVLADYEIVKNSADVVGIVDDIQDAVKKDFAGAKNYVQGRMVYDNIVKKLQAAYLVEKNGLLQEVLDVLTWLMIEKALNLTVKHLMDKDLGAVVSNNKFALFSAPPGGGKGELGDRIYRRYGALVQKFVLITTRPVRPGEVQEREYHFRTVEYLAGMVPTYALSAARGFDYPQIADMLVQNGYAERYTTEGLKENIDGIRMVKDVDGALSGLLSALGYAQDKTDYIVKCLEAARGVKLALDSKKIIVTLVNKQMQGLTTSDVNDLYVGYYGTDSNSNTIKLGMEETQALMSDFVSVKLDGLQEMKANGAKISLLEGGIGWFDELMKTSPELASVFLSPFTEARIAESTADTKIRRFYQAAYLKAIAQHDQEFNVAKGVSRVFIPQDTFEQDAKAAGEGAGKSSEVLDDSAFEKFLKDFEGKDAENTLDKDIRLPGQEERLAQLRGEFYYAAYETTVRIHKREFAAGVMTTDHNNFLERAAEAALQVIRRNEYNSVLVNAFQDSPVAFWAMMYRLSNGFAYEVFGALSGDVVEQKLAQLQPFFKDRNDLMVAAAGWATEYNDAFGKTISAEDILDTQEFFELMQPSRDSNGQPVPTKTIRPRALVHYTGDWHRDIRVFVMDAHGNVFVQKRGPKKDMEPNLIAHGVGGHTGIGETYQDNALREIREEIGLVGIDDARLRSFGIYSEEVFGANHQVNRSHYGLYAYIVTDDEKARMKVDYLDGISKEGTLWMPFSDLKAGVAADVNKEKYVASFFEG